MIVPILQPVMLKVFESPLIVIGKGVAWARAEDEMQRFVEATGIPYLAMPMAKGVIPDDHEQSAAAHQDFRSSSGGGAISREKQVVADAEAIELHADRGQLEPRARGDISGQQPQYRIVTTLDQIEQLPHAWKDVRGPLAAGQLAFQHFDIAIAHRLNVRSAFGMRVPESTEQFVYDLRIGFAVKSKTFDRPGRPHLSQ